MSDRTATANNIVKKYCKWGAGAGLFPVPVLGVAAVTGVQLKMLCELGKVYEIPFQKERAKSIVGALLGAVSAPLLAGTVMTALPALMIVPVVGATVGVAFNSAFSYAATYAVGRVFVTHFDSGGTFLDLDPATVREHFRQEFAGASTPKDAPSPEPVGASAR